MPDEQTPQIDSFPAALAAGFKEAVSCYPSIPKTQVLVAFSGGIDSTAMLLAFNHLREELNLSINACHINHHVRGDEANEDENFCSDLCQQQQIPFFVKHLNFDDAQGTPSEEVLRNARYSELVELAKQESISIIASAHTQDDQSETLLFRLFRGSGRPGLAGIKPARLLDNNILLVRPLIKVSRSDCLQFLSSSGIQPRNDSSNNNLAYRRNFIRHRIIPAIKEMFPQLNQSLRRFHSLVQEEEDLLANLAHAALLELQGPDADVWNLSAFEALPIAIRKRVIWQGMKDRDIEASFERIDNCLSAITNRSAVSLDETWDLRAESDTITWLDKTDSQVLPARFCTDLKVPGVTVIAALNQAVKIEEWVEKAKFSFPSAQSLEAFADLSQVNFPLVARMRQPGDVIQPFGMSQKIKLKKYLHNHKPQSGHNLLVNVVVTDQSEVVWVPGIGLSEKIKVNGQPTHRLSWLPLTSDTAIC